MDDEYSLVERIPTAEEYRRLREAAGWEGVERGAAERGLRNSVFSVCVEHAGEAVGCGRVVGDGGMYFYVQDVIMLPDHRGRGIGACIMGAVMDFLNAHLEHDAFVGLMAAEGTAGFYEKFGFFPRPESAPGMMRAAEKNS